MFPKIRLAIGTGLMLLALSCDKKPSPTQTTAPVTVPAPAADGWIRPFDGKTLAGWKDTDFGTQYKVKVKDGQLILPAADPLVGVTYAGTNLPTINYVLECEAQRIDGGDFFLGLTFPVKKSAASLILGGWGGTVCGISSLDGLDASSNDTTKTIQFESKQWYRVKLYVLDNRLMAWLDDEQLIDVSTEGKQVDVRMEMDGSKPLGLASYQTTGAVRNLKIRPLKAEENPGDRPQEP